MICNIVLWSRKRLHKSIFAYFVKSLLPYLCTPTEAFSSSACVSRSLTACRKILFRQAAAVLFQYRFFFSDFLRLSCTFKMFAKLSILLPLKLSLITPFRFLRKYTAYPKAELSAPTRRPPSRKPLPRTAYPKAELGGGDSPPFAKISHYSCCNCGKTMV